MTLFLKDFMNMEEDKLTNTQVHFGPVEASNRIFNRLIADKLKANKAKTDESKTDKPGTDESEVDQPAYLEEIKLLQNILDEALEGDDGLDLPFDALLRLQFGRDIITATELPAEVLNYLLNTPHDVVQMDFDEVTRSIREAFKRRVTN